MSVFDDESVLNMFFFLRFIDELFEFRWAKVVKLASSIHVQEIGGEDGINSVRVDRDE